MFDPGVIPQWKGHRWQQPHWRPASIGKPHFCRIPCVWFLLGTLTAQNGPMICWVWCGYQQCFLIIKIQRIQRIPRQSYRYRIISNDLQCLMRTSTFTDVSSMILVWVRKNGKQYQYPNHLRIVINHKYRNAPLRFWSICRRREAVFWQRTFLYQ